MADSPNHSYLTMQWLFGIILLVLMVALFVVWVPLDPCERCDGRGDVSCYRCWGRGRVPLLEAWLGRNGYVY
jgi:hypothetical protein